MVTAGSGAAERHSATGNRRRLGRVEGRVVRGVARAPASVRTKLLVGFAGIAVLLVVVGALGLLELGASNSRVQRLGTLQALAASYQGLVADVGHLHDSLLTRADFTSNATNGGMHIGRGARVSSAMLFFLDQTIVSNANVLLGDATVLEVPEPALYQRVYSANAQVETDASSSLQLDERGKGAAAGALVKREFRMTTSLQPVLTGLAGRTKAQADALVAQNRRSFTSSRNLFVGVAAGSVVLALLLGLVLSGSLIAPLRRTEARLGEIAAGDFSGHVEVPNRDEIGALASNVNRMNDELGRLYRELEAANRELELASRHKSDFLANMSHELRTPLNAIIGFSEVLHEQMFGELNEQQLSYVDDILQAGRHLLSLINEVLDLAKIEAGRMELDIGPVSISDVLRSGVTLESERASHGGITLGLSIEPAEITAEADERRVRQVVFNLLSNAIKFTPPEGRVDVSAQLRDGLVEVAVADTGRGIAAEDLERIFEEFEQGRNGAGVTVEGTGLGLPLSRRIVELHGGRLWVESIVGVGSTFRFTLPVRQEVSA